MSWPKPNPPDSRLEPESISQPEQVELEASLKSLLPAQTTFNRDRLMFLAGARSAQAPVNSRRSWIWPSAAALLGVVALAEAVALTQNSPPQERVVERIVVVHEPAHRTEDSPRPVEPAIDRLVEYRSSTPHWPLSLDLDDDGYPLGGGSNYYRLRRQVLRFGVDSLPEPPPLAMQFEPVTPSEAFRSELQSLLTPGGPL
jgi:hypothetical protein